MSIDEASIHLERYKIAMELHSMHDSILWVQSSIFLLSEVTLIGFVLSLSMENWMLRSFLLAVCGIVLAQVWWFFNRRRDHYMKILVQINKKDAYHFFNLKRRSIDVDGEVHLARRRPGIRKLVVHVMPLTSFCVWVAWIGYLLYIFLKIVTI